MLEVLARIRHRRTRRQLSPYVDGMLSARETRRLEEHLAQCQACRDELEELRATVQVLAELPLAEAPRSFALAAAPAPVFRPAARRVEFGLRVATAMAAFVLAVVAASDLLGLPGGEEEENGAALQMAPMQAGVREAGTPEGTLASGQAQPSEVTAEDKVLAETPTPPPAGAGDIGQETPSPPVYGEGVPATTATPEAPAPAPRVTSPSIGEDVPAATMTPAATATPATIAPPATGPGPAETPAPAATPAAAPETPAATATPPPMGAEIAPSESERQPPAEADEGAPAGAERGTFAAEEGGPSRETVVRWLEVGLATGLALLLVSWVLARRRGWA
jgi:hypothetical protein